MIISTMASDKAKYKTMFKDWLVAICLVVMMHYIMIATLNISGLVVKSIGSSGNARSHTEKIMVLLENILADKDEGEGKGRLDIKVQYSRLHEFDPNSSSELSISLDKRYGFVFVFPWLWNKRHCSLLTELPEFRSNSSLFCINCFRFRFIFLCNQPPRLL